MKLLLRNYEPPFQRPTSNIESEAVLAFDKKTGREVWRAKTGAGDSWSTPLIYQVNGRHELTFHHTNSYQQKEKGGTAMEAKPKFRLLAHNRFASDTSVANGTLAVSRGQIFLRSDAFLYCIGKK